MALISAMADWAMCPVATTPPSAALLLLAIVVPCRHRFWTEEEWLAYRYAHQGNSRLITSEVSDAVVIDEPKEHIPQLSQLEIRSTAPSYFPPCVDV